MYIGGRKAAVVWSFELHHSIFNSQWHLAMLWSFKLREIQVDIVGKKHMFTRGNQHFLSKHIHNWTISISHSSSSVIALAMIVNYWVSGPTFGQV